MSLLMYLKKIIEFGWYKHKKQLIVWFLPLIIMDISKNIITQFKRHIQKQTKTFVLYIYFYNRNFIL